MTRVAIIEPVGGHGGMNYYDFSLLRAAIPHCSFIALYTCTETDFEPALREYLYKTYKGIWGSKKNIIRGLNFLRSLLQTCFHAKLKKVEVVHFHFFSYSFLELISILISRFFGFKVVITVHDVESFSSGKSKNFSKSIFKLARRLIVHNKVSAKSLLELDSCLIDKLHIIPHGHYLDFVAKGKAEFCNFGQKGMFEGPTILFFGQIKEVKGLDLLLMAMPRIIQDFPGVKLVIAGKVWKTDFSRYQKIIDSLGISQSVVKEIRYIKDNEVSSFYNSADLVVLPYKKIYQSGVLLMAMSYEKPVVVSDLEGMTEIVKDNYNGFVFKSNDSEDLAFTILRALKSDLKGIVENGLDTVSKDHAWSSIGFETSKVYRSANEE